MLKKKLILIVTFLFSTCFANYATNYSIEYSDFCYSKKINLIIQNNTKDNCQIINTFFNTKAINDYTNQIIKPLDFFKIQITKNKINKYLISINGLILLQCSKLHIVNTYELYNIDDSAFAKCHDDTLTIDITLNQ